MRLRKRFRGFGRAEVFGIWCTSFVVEGRVFWLEEKLNFVNEA